MPVPGITIAGTNQSLDTSVNMVISEFRLIPDADGPMRRVSTDLTLEPGEGPTKYINNYGRVTGYQIADGSDANNPQQLADTQHSYSPTEVVAQVLLSGRTITRVADRQILSNTAKILKNALKLKMDRDGTAILSSFVPIVGAAGTVLSPGLIAAAVAIVEVGNSLADPEPYDDLHIVLHPMHLLELGGRLVPYSNVPTGTNVYGVADGAHAGVTLTNAGGTGPKGSLADQIVRKGPRSMTELQGYPVVIDANIAVDSSNDASGAVFDRSAVNYVTEEPMTIDEDRSDKSMRGAVEFTAWYSGVWGGYRLSNAGCEILADAAMPTS